MAKNKLTIIIPVFNEKGSLKKTIFDIQKVMKGFKKAYEIICVDDCSSDGCDKILGELSKKKIVRVITHPQNKGYGSSLKTGLRNSDSKWILITDADGTYPVKDIPRLWKARKDCDMIVGSRTKKGVKIPILRRPAKWLIKMFASFLTGRIIPDINSGFRLFKRDLAMEFIHLYPPGFSFTSTITLAAFTNDYSVRYVPIDYYKRQGKSSMKPHDFFMFISLIFRIMIYFRPLRFFLLPGGLMLLLGIGYGIFQFIAGNNIAQFPVLTVLAGIQICFMGILADLIIKSRK